MSENKSISCCKKQGTGIFVMIGLVALGLFIGKGLTRIAYQDQYVTV